MGIGDWGLGIGDWGLGPIPNPQSPIPNPQSPMLIKKIFILFKQYKNIIFIFIPHINKIKKLKDKKYEPTLIHLFRFYI